MRDKLQPVNKRADLNGSPSRQIKVCILGAKGAGKTSFLAGLALLSEPNRSSIVNAVQDNNKTAIFLDELRKTLCNRREWPPATNATVVLDMTVKVATTAIDLRVVDYAGEDFTKELRTLDLDCVEELHRFTQEADVFLLLFSPQHDLTDKNSESLVERQQAHLQAISQVWKERSGDNSADNGKKGLPELGLIITQCDRVPGLGGSKAAKQYFDKHAPHLAKKLATLASSVRYFAVSVIGPPNPAAKVLDTLTTPPPKDLAPYGYEPLFRWICGHRARRRWWRKPRALVGMALVLFMLIAIPLVVRETRSAQVRIVVANPNLTEVEKVEQSTGWVNQRTGQIRADFLRSLVNRLGEEISNASTDEDFRQLEAELRDFLAAKPVQFVGEFNQLLTVLTDRERRIRHEALIAGSNQSPPPNDQIDRCRDFIEKYRSGTDVEDVRKILEKIEVKEIRERRDAIKAMPLRTAKDVAAKATAIADFVREFEQRLPDEEAAGMRKAAEIARIASSPGNWEVSIVRSGGLTVAYRQSVIISKGRRGDNLHMFDGAKDGAPRDKTWTADPAFIPWTSGEPLAVRLKIEGRFLDVFVGVFESTGPMAIGALVGRTPLNVEPGGEGYTQQPYIECRVKPPGGTTLTPDDWQAVEDFITPGNRW